MSNRKGFAISVIMYSILLLFIVLLASIMGILANRKTLLDKSKQDVTSFLNVAESNISAVSSVNYVLYGESNPLPGIFFNTDSSNVQCTIDSAVYTNTNALDDGIYDVTCTITYEDLKYGSASTKIHVVRNQYDFEYTGNYQEFKVYRTGYYQLETWGAEGGTGNNYAGGKGGYATGVKYLEEGETVYIYVGGKGASECITSYTNKCYGGYNGGGNAGAHTSSTVWTAGGGGATHMATRQGLLSTLSDDRDSVLIVAAGGGGGSFHSSVTYSGIGGAGGGLNGVLGEYHHNSYKNEYGATQNLGGITNNTSYGKNGEFGQGGNAVNATTYASGGGGGWYGGAAILHAGAGGGSSYIGGVISTSTISKNTISGNQDMPSYISGTMNGNSGDGYAKIKFIGVEAETANYEDKTEFTYTGNYQEFIVPETGYYKVEAWGAQGNSSPTYAIANAGKGGYTSGVVRLTAGEKLYIYVGSGGMVSDQGGYNGGGNSGSYTTAGSGGGGATDIRYFGSVTPNPEDLIWNSTLGLRARVMVAGGGGGSGAITANISKPDAGGLTGLRGYETSYINNAGFPGNQTSGGAIATNYSAKPGLTAGTFGAGGNGNPSISSGWGAGGGAGYYGGSGGSGAGTGYWPGAGGSSYISGYKGSVAINSATDQSPKAGCLNGTIDEICSYHYSGLKFLAATMLAGNDIMPNPTGGNNITGNSGNGYVIISRYNPDEVDFEYRGYIQAFSASKTGYYQLETWGAEGGTSSGIYVGGKGGYATGVKYLEEGETVYVYVGGSGKTCHKSTIANCTGGYNGGGTAGYYTGDGMYAGSGGGATHIATNSGILSTLSDDRDSILIVAGGGGGGMQYSGATHSGIGGSGGGLVAIKGTNGSQIGTDGGSQIRGSDNNHSYGTAGTFGQGGSAVAATNYISGGGGGWYGAGAAIYAGSGGGSSYIGGVFSITTLQKETISGDESIPTYDGDDTMTGNTGDGHAKVTYLGSVATRTYNDETYFTYMNKEETFTAPITGYYELEAWGAQGGNANGKIGGKGGYSQGVIYLQQGEEIKINVGSRGGSNCITSYTAKCYGGYNGGGNAGAHTGGTVYTGGGGGATHIAKSSGLLIDFEFDRSNLLLVAGGGGAATMYDGAKYSANGGAGGGFVGGASILGSLNSYGGCTPGSQTSGGKGNHTYADFGLFGKGGNATGTTSYATGGGGGFYGGSSCLHASAPGGSSWIDGVDSTISIERKTLSGDEEVPTYEGLSTMVGNLKDGAAKVTYVGAVETVVESDFSHLENLEYTYFPRTQLYIAPYTGYYKLEAWGAQGGYQNATYRGGYGGYSAGYYYAEKGDYIYIYTGGQGTSSGTAGTAVSGGYNGGGLGYGMGAGGGGATHFSTSQGLLSELSSNTESLIMVAGGGGGAVYYSSASPSGIGGDAGGAIGTAGTTGGWATVTGQPGTQTSGGTFGMYTTTQCGYAGTFGQGGSGNPSSSACPNNYIGGGGAGYYGGGSARHAGGGGGSGYLNTDKINASKMICFGCENDSNLESLTYSTNNVSSTSISEYVKTGNGSAKVVWMGNGELLYVNPNGGTYENDTELISIIAPGETFNLSVPVRENYIFIGWNIEGSGTTINNNVLTMGSTNATITALWESAETTNVLYSGSAEEYLVSQTGRYRIQLWGASGITDATGGKGGYTSGIISLQEGEIIYVYVGQQGIEGEFGNNTTSTVGQGGIETFNGGGPGGLAGGGSYPYANYKGGSSGGGATDIRCFIDTNTQKCVANNSDLLWDSELG